MKKKKVKVTEFSKLENKVAALWTRVSTEKQEKNNCSLAQLQRQKLFSINFQSVFAPLSFQLVEYQ